jgi:hypothetical protein
MDAPKDTNLFMRRYGTLMDEGVQSGQPDGQALAHMFADHCVASSPAGVMGGEGGTSLAQIIPGAIANYRRLGGTRFVMEQVDVTAIDDLHDMARVGWRFDYRRPSDGTDGSVSFQNTYFVTRASGRPKIFAWITPDEQAALKAHGLA